MLSMVTTLTLGLHGMALNKIDVVNGDNGMALNYIDVANGDNCMGWH